MVWKPPFSKKRWHMKAITVRFLEFLLISIILSLTVIGLYYIRIVPRNYGSYGICFSIGVIVYIMIQVRMMKNLYFAVNDRKSFYIINLIAYAIYMFVGIVVYMFIDKKYIYLNVFGITRFLAYFNEKISIMTSATIFHIIMLIVIYFAPMGLADKLKPEADIEDEFIKENAELLDNSEDETNWDGTEDYTNNPEKEWYKPDEINFSEDGEDWDGTEDYTNNPEKEWYKPDEINFSEEEESWDGTSDYHPYIPERRKPRKKRW